MSTILFSNFSWWAIGEDNQLRRGIRAGSRWPFMNHTRLSPDKFQFGEYTPFPFFMASAAAYAERAVDGMHTVIFRDSIARAESYMSFFRYVKDLAPDCLILETGAASWDHDRKVLGHLKMILPNMRIAVAGPTAKTAHESEMKPGQVVGPVDAFLQGEFEKNAVDFINGASGLLPFQMLTREELHKLPFPMFDEACALNYWDACPQGQQAPHLQVWASRGCVWKCAFCAWPANMTNNDPDGTAPRSIRHYSAEWVEAFIRERMAKATAAGTPLRSIYFDDDYFNNNKRHVLEICAAMKRIGLPWSAMCRADTSDKETWIAMRDSGCFGVKVGFESGSQRVIDKIINKHLNIEKAVEWCAFLKSIGISVHTTWTLGTPGELPEERQMTKDLIARMYREKHHDTHQESGTAVIDGTPLSLIEQGVHLAKYPDAKVDENYKSSKDGVSKLESSR